MPDINEYLKSKLNEQQYAAALYEKWDSLILAGAGSGKTRTLTYKIANLIYGHGIHPSNILAVTFTNKAANEMKTRLQEIMEEIREANSSVNKDTSTKENKDAFDFDELLSAPTSSSKSNVTWPRFPTYQHRDYQRIGTFHSVFLKILKKDIKKLWMKYTTGFTIYDASSDVPALIKSIIKQLGMKDMLQRRETHRKISSWKSKWRLPEQAGIHCETQQDERILEIYQKYQRALEDGNALDFDDLLLLSKELFEKSPETLQKRQKQFQHILVDEAQDTNALQFDLMRKLSNVERLKYWNVETHKTITFIWDDYQSIYRWRGAMMDNFLNVDKRWSTIKTFKLEINYRSKPHIVEAGNALIKMNKKQYDKKVSAHRQWNDKIRIFGFSDEVDEAMQIIELISKIKEEQERKWLDFTILYRTNAQSSPFEQILLTEWIPYKVVGAFKFFERREIKDIISYVKYLLNPRDSIALKRIINTPKRSIGKTSIDKLEALANTKMVNLANVVANIDTYATGLNPTTQTKIKSFNHLLQSMLHAIDMLTVKQLIEQIFKETQYEQYLIKVEGTEKAEERMENIGQLINIAAKYDTIGKEWVIQFMDEISLMTSIEEEGRDEADAIKLMSVHASKGLEFPYVFIVGLEEGIFPLPKAKFDEAELEEERRGMYVAITRAKDHLFLSYASSRQQRGQIKYNPPSRFLEEIPENLIKRYDLWGQSKRQKWPSFDEWDLIKHKLFGPGKILELRDEIAIIKFDNPKFGLRKLETRFLEKI